MTYLRRVPKPTPMDGQYAMLPWTVPSKKVSKQPVVTYKRKRKWSLENA